MACNSLWRSSWRCSVWSPSPSSASAPSCSTRFELLRKGFFCQHHHCSTSTASATWAPSATSAPATEELESARKKCRGESLYLPTGYKDRSRSLEAKIDCWGWEPRRCSGQRESLALRTVPLSPRTPLRWDGLFLINVYKNANKFLWEGKKTFLLNTPNTDQVINRNQNQEGWISV